MRVYSSGCTSALNEGDQSGAPEFYWWWLKLAIRLEAAVERRFLWNIRKVDIVYGQKELEVSDVGILSLPELIYQWNSARVAVTNCNAAIWLKRGVNFPCRDPR
jgi:hypothetical protein